MDNQLNRQFQQLNKSIRRANNILIAAHKFPDGDALGSMLSLTLALEGKEVVPYISGPSPNFRFLPGFSKIKNKISPKKFDFLIGLDYGDFERLGIRKDFLSENKIITIDHHLPSDQRGSLQIIRPDFSSTSEILYYFFKKVGIEINKDIATCLLAGIYTDSGGFKYAVTSSLTLDAAADLMQKGASLSQIIKETTSLKSPAILKLWGKALSRIEKEPETGMVYSWITHDDLKRKRLPEDLGVGELASVISMISGAPFTLLLVENQPKEFKGSLRSEFYHNVDVSKIAEVFGGGGHKLAAGFEKKGDMNEIVKAIKKNAKIRTELV